MCCRGVLRLSVVRCSLFIVGCLLSLCVCVVVCCLLLFVVCWGGLFLFVVVLVFVRCRLPLRVVGFCGFQVLFVLVAGCLVLSVRCWPLLCCLCCSLCVVCCLLLFSVC